VKGNLQDREDVTEGFADVLTRLMEWGPAAIAPHAGRPGKQTGRPRTLTVGLMWAFPVGGHSDLTGRDPSRTQPQAPNIPDGRTSRLHRDGTAFVTGEGRTRAFHRRPGLMLTQKGARCRAGHARINGSCGIGVHLTCNHFSRASWRATYAAVWASWPARRRPSPSTTPTRSGISRFWLIFHLPSSRVMTKRKPIMPRNMTST
jgi:hypothetical protein